MKCLMWAFALIFMQELNWSFFIDNFGFWGAFYAYIIICWGEVILYTAIVKKWGLLDYGSKVSKM